MVLLQLSTNHQYSIMLKKVLFIAACFCGLTLSAQSEIPATKESVQVPESAQMFSTACQLVKYGYAQGEALPLIQAAQILQNVTGGAIQEKPETEGATEDEATKAESKVQYDPAKLLADAAALADGDATLLALVEEVKNSATRGPVGDYDVTSTCVRANATDVYHIRFRANETAVCIVSGDGDTDLDLFIYDSNGNLIDSDTDNTDDCVCTWTPRWTGTFTIKVKNYGRISNCYKIGVG